MASPKLWQDPMQPSVQHLDHRWVSLGRARHLGRNFGDPEASEKCHKNGGFIAGMWVISGKMVKKPTEMEVKKVNVVISGDGLCQNPIVTI